MNYEEIETIKMSENYLIIQKLHLTKTINERLEKIGLKKYKTIIGKKSIYVKSKRYRNSTEEVKVNVYDYLYNINELVYLIENKKTFIIRDKEVNIKEYLYNHWLKKLNPKNDFEKEVLLNMDLQDMIKNVYNLPCLIYRK